MKHVYVETEDTLYSFAQNSVVKIYQPNVSDDALAGSTAVNCVRQNPIFYAGIALTNLCNLNCKHCPVNITNQPAKARGYSRSRIVQLVDDLVAQGLARVSVTGGEPLLYPFLIQFFKHLHQHGIESKINTNGILLKPELVEQLIPLGLDEIDVSINELEDDSDTYYDGINRARLRLRNLETLAKNFKGRVTITASSVLTSRIANNLGAVETRLADCGADRWRLRELLLSQMKDTKTPERVFPDIYLLVQNLRDFVASPRKLEVYGYLYDTLATGKVTKRCKDLEANYVYAAFTGDIYWMSGLTSAQLGTFPEDSISQVADELARVSSSLEVPDRCDGCSARYMCLVSPCAYRPIKDLESSYRVE